MDNLDERLKYKVDELSVFFFYSSNSHTLHNIENSLDLYGRVIFDISAGFER